MPRRRKSRRIHVGGVAVGGNAPISVQSMTNTPTEDVEATARQIRGLEEAGCEIVRVAVPTKAALKALSSIKSRISIPLEADIHFEAGFARDAILAGVDAIRLNPGNIAWDGKVKDVARLARDRGVAVRVGANSGSIEGIRTARLSSRAMVKLMVERTLGFCELLESSGLSDIMISAKAADVRTTIEAYRRLGRACDYPLHLGVTATGTYENAVVKSAIAMGALLSDGIGDTIRVSISGDPVDEVRVGQRILQSLGLRTFGHEVMACPTCGRCEIDVAGIAAEVERRLSKIPGSLKVAVMGCVVNGPGEARSADIGIAGGKKCGVIFRNGERIRKVREADLVSELMKEIVRMT